MDLTTYQGTCQCGQVKYALQSRPITQVLECNCSMCGRAGALWTAATDADLLDPTRWAVNVRCIDGVDVAALKVIPFEGKNWEAAAKAFIERRK